jgi:hypothetical protein
VYVGRRYTATVTGSVWKTVACEFCKLEWAYKMMRTAQGTGRSPYFLDNDGASQRAGDEARETLARKLDGDVDAVGCPKCNRLQSHMFGKARMMEFGHWYWIAGVTAVLAFVFCCFWGYTPWIENCVSPPGVFIFAAAAVMLFSAILRSRMFDPNQVAELRKRKNRICQNERMLRTEYEAALDAAREKGVDPSKLVSLTWPRRRRA